MNRTNHPESQEEAIARWQEWQASTCNQSTIDQRTDDVLRLREHAAARIGRALDDVDARAMDAEDISAWLARKDPRPLAANSKWRYFRSLRSWFGWLHRTGRIAVDPTVDIRSPRKKKTLPKPLTDDEVRRVLDGAPLRLLAMLALALYAGLRAHEIAAFRGEQIRDRWIDVTGKGDRDAFVPLAPQLAEVALRMPREGWWFPSRRAACGHLVADTVGNLVAARYRELGIAVGSIHRMRHTGATNIQRHGRDLRVTQRWLRHASVATTEIYTEVAEDDMHDALGGLPPLSA